MSVQTDCGVLVFTPHSRSDPDDDSNSVPFPKNFKGIGILPTLTSEGSLESRAQVKDLLGCIQSKVTSCKKKCFSSGSNYEGCSTCSAGKAYLSCKGKPPLRGKDFGSEYKPGPPIGRTMPPVPKKLTRKEKDKLREKIEEARKRKERKERGSTGTDGDGDARGTKSKSKSSKKSKSKSEGNENQAKKPGIAMKKAKRGKDGADFDDTKKEAEANGEENQSRAAAADLIDDATNEEDAVTDAADEASNENQAGADEGTDAISDDGANADAISDEGANADAISYEGANADASGDAETNLNEDSLSSADQSGDAENDDGENGVDSSSSSSSSKTD